MRAPEATDDVTAAPVFILVAPALPWPCCFLPKFRRLVCVDRCPDGGVGTTLTLLAMPLLLLPRDGVGADDGIITGTGVLTLIDLSTVGVAAVLLGTEDNVPAPVPVPAYDEAGGTGRSDDPPESSRACDWSCCC